MSRRDGRRFVEETNIDDDDMTFMHLARRGYGSLREMKDLDTPELLDLIEFENISADIEEYLIWEAKHDRGN